jgi:hypothetical protein
MQIHSELVYWKLPSMMMGTSGRNTLLCHIIRGDGGLDWCMRCPRRDDLATTSTTTPWNPCPVITAITAKGQGGRRRGSCQDFAKFHPELSTLRQETPECRGKSPLLLCIARILPRVSPALAVLCCIQENTVTVLDFTLLYYRTRGSCVIRL